MQLEVAPESGPQATTTIADYQVFVALSVVFTVVAGAAAAGFAALLMTMLRGLKLA